MYSIAQRSRSAGFTLIELMLVLAIVGVVAGMATPSVLKLMPEYRLQGAASQMAWNLQALRMQAISQHHTITVTFTTNQTYTVWNDRNDNGVQDTGEVQTKRLDTRYGDVRFTTTNNPVFQPSGLVTNLPTVTLTGAGGTKTLTMNAAGNVNLS